MSISSPSYVSEEALLEVSRMQREAMVSKALFDEWSEEDREFPFEKEADLVH